MTPTDSRPVPTASRLQRWLLVAAGVLCVGLGAIGAVLPGLPTTVFLLAASWCFARSCPWLEDRLLRIPLFRPFMAFVRPGARMPPRAAATALVMMWTAITVSAALMVIGSDPRPVVAGVLVAAGIVGSWVILRLRERPSESALSVDQ